MRDVDVIDDPAAAVAALEPIRARLLAELAQPGSASTLAERVGLPRQRVNYHLRTLEAHGLVRLVREQPRRGLTERIMQASAAAYVVSPGALGQAAADPERTADRLSASYHDADAPGGRAYRLIVAGHPLPIAATHQEEA